MRGPQQHQLYGPELLACTNFSDADSWQKMQPRGVQRRCPCTVVHPARSLGRVGEWGGHGLTVGGTWQAQYGQADLLQILIFYITQAYFSKIFNQFSDQFF